MGPARRYAREAGIPLTLHPAHPVVTPDARRIRYPHRADKAYESCHGDGPIRRGRAALESYQRRAEAIAKLLRYSESQLESFFFSVGLAPEFSAPGHGWGRQKRITTALTAAEQRGDVEAVLDLIDKHFPPAGTVESTDAGSPVTHPSGGVHSNALAVSATATADPVTAAAQSAAEEPTTPTPSSEPTAVFVVHGHDDLRREQVARLIERVGKGLLEAVVLAEQVNNGLTIIEKFERYARRAGFAVVLATADDLGSARDAGASRNRARQNVIFELGYFTGSLGREKVTLLRESDVEIPSDLAGVVYLDIDGAGAWKHALAREMAAAGLPVDFAQIR